MEQKSHLEECQNCLEVKKNQKTHLLACHHQQNEWLLNKLKYFHKTLQITPCNFDKLAPCSTMSLYNVELVVTCT
jgi:hypothetical protein